MRHEAPFHCSVSKEISPSLLRLERVRGTLDARSSPNTRLHSRGTPRVPPQLKKSPVFPSSSRDEGPIPCFIGKGILAFQSHLWRRSQIERLKELQWSFHHSNIPGCPNPLQVHRIPHPDSTVTTSIDSNTMASVTALWHLERKPQIPMATRQES